MICIEKLLIRLGSEIRIHATWRQGTPHPYLIVDASSFVERKPSAASRPLRLYL